MSVRECLFFSHERRNKKAEFEDLKKLLVKNGGPMRDRTADLNTASVALSQLSYEPTNELVKIRYSKKQKSPRTISWAFNYI